MLKIILLLILLNLLAFFARDSLLSFLSPDRGLVAAQKNPGTATIVLLSEREKAAASEPTEERHVQPLPEKTGLVSESTEKQLCWYVGINGQLVSSSSSDEQRVLSQLGRRFASLGIAAELREVPIVEEAHYVVYVEVAASEREKVLREKLAKGINAYLVKDGSLENAIVLGSYQQEQEAEAAIRQFVDDGESAKLALMAQNADVLRLVLTDAEHDKLSDKLWGRLRLDWPEVFKEKKFCQGVAPGLKLE